jgi:hypothetical protein
MFRRYYLASPPEVTYPEALIALSPTTYWRLGDASGNAQDSSGNARHLTAGGTPTYSTAGWAGDGGTGISFDADHFTLGDAAWMDFGTNDFTIVFVMRHASGWPAANEQIIGHDGQGNLGQWMVYLIGSGPDQIRLRMNHPTTGVTNVTFTTAADLLDSGSWVWCTIACDRSANAVLYVNGTTLGAGLEYAQDASAAVGYDLTNARALWLGASSAVPDIPYVGDLCEVALWNGTLLSQAQLQALYDARG